MCAEHGELSGNRTVHVRAGLSVGWVGIKRFPCRHWQWQRHRWRHVSRPSTPASATLVRVYEVGLAFRHGCAQSRPRPVCPCDTSRVALWGWYIRISDFLAIVVLKARYLNIEEANMADSAISNLLRKNVGWGLKRTEDRATGQNGVRIFMWRPPDNLSGDRNING